MMQPSLPQQPVQPGPMPAPAGPPSPQMPQAPTPPMAYGPQPPKKKTGLIITIVILVVLVIGAAVGVTLYFVLGNKDKSGSRHTDDSQPRRAVDLTKEFVVTNDKTSPRVIKLTMKLPGLPGESSKQMESTIEIDDKGNSRSTDNSSSKVSYSIDGALYTCEGSKCTKHNTEGLPGKPSKLNLEEMAEKNKQKMEERRSRAVYKGKKSCSAGECYLWEIPGTDGLPKEDCYLDSKGRVVHTITGDGSAVMEVTFKSVERIKLPS